MAIINRLRLFGHAPLCNLRPERAFRVGSFVFPLCARCTGLVVGVIVCFGCQALGAPVTLPVIVSIIMALPLPVDWTLQRAGILESTNARRFVTGIFFGFALTPHSIYISI